MYSKDSFISKCCDSFIYYDDLNCKCTRCGNVLFQLTDDIVTLNVRFNNENVNNVGGDTIQTFRIKAQRFATDKTYELCSFKCPKCESLCRYARDPKNDICFICSNGDCRNVIIRE
jgi:uncharacterized C2H2 Zn-finger protein